MTAAWLAYLAVIEGVPVLAYTPEALLGIVVLLVLTGQLQPKRTVDLLLKAAEKRDEQLDKLLAQVGVSNELAKALVQKKAENETDNERGDPA